MRILSLAFVTAVILYALEADDKSHHHDSHHKDPHHPHKDHPHKDPFKGPPAPSPSKAPKGKDSPKHPDKPKEPDHPPKTDEPPSPTNPSSPTTNTTVPKGEPNTIPSPSPSLQPPEPLFPGKPTIDTPTNLNPNEPNFIPAQNIPNTIPIVVQPPIVNAQDNVTPNDQKEMHVPVVAPVPVTNDTAIAGQSPMENKASSPPSNTQEGFANSILLIVACVIAGCALLACVFVCYIVYRLKLEEDPLSLFDVYRSVRTDPTVLTSGPGPGPEPEPAPHPHPAHEPAIFKTTRPARNAIIPSASSHFRSNTSDHGRSDHIMSSKPSFEQKIIENNVAYRQLDKVDNASDIENNIWYSAMEPKEEEGTEFSYQSARESMHSMESTRNSTTFNISQIVHDEEIFHVTASAIPIQSSTDSIANYSRRYSDDSFHVTASAIPSQLR